MNKKEVNYNGLAHAPYNFVPFEKNVFRRYDSMNELPRHNQLYQDRYSGTITYYITPETAIFIGGSNEKEFYKDEENQYAIPASTVRGLVRSNMRVLGLGAVGEEIQDAKLMYRAVGASKNNPLKVPYETILGQKQVVEGKNRYSVLTNVKAGYLKKEDGKYFIYSNVKDRRPSKNGMNYYILSERTVFELSKQKNNPVKLLKDRNNTKLLNMGEEFKCTKDRNGRIHYTAFQNKNYTPMYEAISFELKGERSVIAVGEPGEYTHTGYITMSGAMNEKKALYIIPEIDDSKEPIEIPKKDIDNYNVDWNMKKNILKEKGRMRNREGNYWELPRDGEEARPIFYIQLDGKLYFGFTPRLRLFYQHSILEGVPEQHISKEEVILDYVKSIFGFTSKKQSYRSRVQFLDAVLDSGEPQIFEDTLVSGEPKPTSYRDYLTSSDGEVATYNDSDFQLRGVKQYWFHKQDPIDKKEKEEGKENIKNEIKPMKKGVVFKGKIHFHNLAKDELGLLLWSIQLNSDSRQNLGKGKWKGYGRVRVQVEDLYIKDQGLAYKRFDRLFLNTKTKVVSPDTYIKEYKQYFKSKIVRFDTKSENDVENYPSIKGFFAMKSEKNLLDEYKVTYMSIQNREYQNRKENLPTIQQVLGNYYTSIMNSSSNKGEQKGNTNQKLKFNKNQKKQNDNDKATMADLFKDIHL